MQKTKYKGFSAEDGRVVNVAYFDGYDFGDRLLEGVPFKAEVEKGKLHNLMVTTKKI